MKGIIYQSYSKLLQDLSSEGHTFADTVCFINTSFVLNRYMYVNGSDKYSYRQLLLPADRGNKRVSIKYAAAESAWYAMKTRDPAVIIPYGKIWERMRDSNGMVNSNYGYQIVTNNDIGKSIDYLLANKPGLYDRTVTFAIASPDNYKLKHDTVCNNAVSIRFKERSDITDQHVIDVEAVSIARSIDVMFGLPYDLFALQGFTSTLIDIIRNKIISVKCDHITLDTVFHFNRVIINAANMHMYNKDIEYFKTNTSSFGDAFANDNVFGIELGRTGYHPRYLCDGHELNIDSIVLSALSKYDELTCDNSREYSVKLFDDILLTEKPGETSMMFGFKGIDTVALAHDRKVFNVVLTDNHLTLNYCVPTFDEKKATMIVYDTALSK